MYFLEPAGICGKAPSRSSSSPSLSLTNALFIIDQCIECMQLDQSWIGHQCIRQSHFAHCVRAPERAAELPDSSANSAPASCCSTFARNGITSLKLGSRVQGGLMTNMPLPRRPKPSGDGVPTVSVTFSQPFAGKRLSLSDNWRDSCRCSSGYQTA